MPSTDLLFVGFIIAVALTFDLVNGMHDAANSIATVVATRVLRPLQAVAWAATFNFLAAFFFGVNVANTIGKGVIDSGVVDERLILAALVGAIVWDMITWYLGLPSSSSHALIGGLVGAAIAKAGVGAIIFTGVERIVVFIVLSPLIGFCVAASVALTIRYVFRSIPPAIANGGFQKLQLLSAGLYSLSHGTNDAQKTMGIIAVLLFSTGHISEFHVPLWVVLSAHAAISIGTLFGGWRIVHTMGNKITTLQPWGGFSAEMAAASSIIYASATGIPVSTTHTITGAITGVGAARRLSAVRWGVAGNIVWAWIVTIPAAALIAAAMESILRMF
jgi:PiT family inorganic phosphate transporter